VPAAAQVIVTRSGEGDDADYEAGLIFRAELASALNAHALVSIHNNAGFDTTSETAASDVYYQSDIAESRRLAALLVAEFARSFAPFDADWVATEPVGAKSRLSPRDASTQYYGLLRRAEVPAVIAEGAYIANQSEADLLATPEFRQAYADAVYRALVRFITTDDAGGISHDPVVWEGHAGSGGARPECELPEQPAG
jgi:N-acetylmuramoyl-L-alanine amidase